MDLLAQQIWQCMDLDLLQGAEFLAEQMLANADTAYSRYLLATVYYRQSQFATAMSIVKSSLRNLDCAWIFGKCCLKLKKGEEGIRAIEAVRKQWDVDNDMPFPSVHGRCELSSAGFHLLLAQLLALSNSDMASEASTLELIKSAQLNPFLIENVLPLAESTNTHINPSSLFSRFEDPFGPSRVPDIQEDAPSVHRSAVTSTPRRFDASPFLSTPLVPNGNNNNSATVNATTIANSTQELNLNGNTTNTGNFSANVSNSADILSPPAANRPIFQPAAGFGLLQTPLRMPPPSVVPASKLRPERVFSLSFKRQDQSSFSTLGKNIFGSPVNNDHMSGFGRSGPGISAIAASAGASAHVSRVNAGAQEALAGLNAPETSHINNADGIDAFNMIFEAIELFSQAEFSQALQQLERLSRDVQMTSFVLSMKGRCYLELAEYSKGADIYKTLKKMQPGRYKDMEYYSTALWHLKKEQDLDMLAYDLTNKSNNLRRHWQSWCVLGNAFSLKKDTANAIKCFERACIINPKCAYVLTLMGYEYISDDEFQSAIVSFVKALTADPQKYNAWYGLGSVYYSLGKYSEAEIYFLQAVRLNPNNSILLCLLGAVYENLDNTVKALDAYTRACTINPDLPIPRFRKAELLVSQNKSDEALEELHFAAKLAPEDYNIQIALGSVYGSLNEKLKAMQHLTYALQLAPKSALVVRQKISALEKELGKN